MNFVRTVLATLLLGTTTGVSPNNEPKNIQEPDFIFLNRFKLLSMHKKLKVKSINRSDEFWSNLKHCQPKFYEGIKSFKHYYLEDVKKVNQINVTEYIFNDSAAADKSYSDVLKYANFTRTLSRHDYNQLCYPLYDPQVYYALKIKSHVFLFTFYFPFVYESPNNSVDAIINNTTAILIDDMYAEMLRDTACQD